MLASDQLMFASQPHVLYQCLQWFEFESMREAGNAMQCSLAGRVTECSLAELYYYIILATVDAITLATVDAVILATVDALDASL